jgi:formate--tetrahydrofolate ligase
VLATKLARKLADYTVTEAGFGADLGAEKFLHIKCRTAGLDPSAVVLVVTKRAYAAHGIENVLKHVENIRAFNLPVVVSINRFLGDSPAELSEIERACADAGVAAHVTDFRERGGSGGTARAEHVCELCEQPSQLTFLYPLDAPIVEKIETVARQVYGARGIELTNEAKREIGRIENLGFRNVPICIAKTPASLTDNPKRSGRPRDFTITVTSARVSAGAGFVVVYTGKVMTMPGLPKQPAALSIDVDDAGNISGLF